MPPKTLIRASGLLLVFLLSATASSIAYKKSRISFITKDAQLLPFDTPVPFNCNDENELNRENLNLLKSTDIKRMVMDGNMIYLFLSNNKTINFVAPTIANGCQRGTHCLIKRQPFIRMHKSSPIHANQPFGYFTYNELRRIGGGLARSTYELPNEGCGVNETLCMNALDFSANNMLGIKNDTIIPNENLLKLLRNLTANFSASDIMLLRLEMYITENIYDLPIPPVMYEADYNSSDLVLKRHQPNLENNTHQIFRTQTYKLQTPIKFAGLYHQLNSSFTDDVFYLYEIDKEGRFGVRQFEVDNFEMLAHITVDLGSFLGCLGPVEDPNEVKGILEIEDRVFVFINQMYLEIDANQLTNGALNIQPSQYQSAKSLLSSWTKDDLKSFERDDNDLLRLDAEPFKFMQVKESNESVEFKHWEVIFKIKPGNYFVIYDRLFKVELEKDRLILKPVESQGPLFVSRSCTHRLFVVNNSFYCHQENEYFRIRLNEDRFWFTKPDRFEFSKLFEDIPKAFGEEQRVEHVFQFQNKIAILTQTHLFLIKESSLRILDSGELYNEEASSQTLRKLPIKLYESVKIHDQVKIPPVKDCPSYSTARIVYPVFLALAIVSLVLFAVWQFVIKR